MVSITSIESIFEKFLSQIDDYELALIEDEDVIEKILYNHFENAIATFYELGKLGVDYNIVPPWNEEFLLENTTFDDLGINGINLRFKEVLRDEHIDDDIISLFYDSREEYDSAVMLFDNPNSFNGDQGALIKSNVFFFKNYTNDLVPFELSGEITNVPYKDGVDFDYKILPNLGGAVVVFRQTPVEQVKVKLDFQGVIDKQLGLDEIHIIVQGMVLSWLQVKINREENLRNYVSDRDMVFLSSANLLDKLLKLDEKTRKNYSLARQRYALRGFGGWN